LHKVPGTLVGIILRSKLDEIKIHFFGLTKFWAGFGPNFLRPFAVDLRRSYLSRTPHNFALRIFSPLDASAHLSAFESYFVLILSNFGLVPNLGWASPKSAGDNFFRMEDVTRRPWDLRMTLIHFLFSTTSPLTVLTFPHSFNC